MSETENAYEALLSRAAIKAKRYLAEINLRKVRPDKEDIRRLTELGGILPIEGASSEDVIDLLDRVGSPATMAVMGRRFFGWVIGGSLPVTVAAHWIADAWDQNACLFEASPVAAVTEEIVLGWLIELFDLPKQTAGALVVGTQSAHITALAAARHALLRREGWDVEADGLFGAPPINVIVGKEAHATLFKALSLIGLGRKRVVEVPVDAQGRMEPNSIPRLSGPTIICTQLGNVNTGSCDPIGEICNIAHKTNAWVHVDGAFGMWAAASPVKSHLAAGLGSADSWATEGHKWLNTPQDCGVALVRDAAALSAAMSVSGAYYGEQEGRDSMRWCPDSSRRARSVEIWAALRFLGRRGIAVQIERTCQLAERFAHGLRALGCVVLNDVELNQVLVSFGPGELTDRVIKAVQEEGICWCGGTTWREQRAMRISVCSWATAEDDVDTCLASIKRALAAARGTNA